MGRMGRMDEDDGHSDGSARLSNPSASAPAAN